MIGDGSGAYYQSMTNPHILHVKLLHLRENCIFYFQTLLSLKLKSESKKCARRNDLPQSRLINYDTSTVVIYNCGSPQLHTSTAVSTPYCVSALNYAVLGGAIVIAVAAAS